MQKAKAFFDVSLGILALAAAFHLGARSAQGQGGGAPIVIGEAEGEGIVAVDRSGQLWMMRGGYPGPAIGPLMPPRASTPIAVSAQTYLSPPSSVRDLLVMVMYDDGEVHQWKGLEDRWEYLGNILGSAPIPTTPTTCGRVKAERP